MSRSRSTLALTTTRPVGVMMVFLAVIVFGGFSIRLLPLNLMPDISYPRLSVRTEYPGAAPGEVETHVARVLEEGLGVVTGLTRIESVSRAGVCDVVLEFAWSTDMDDANQDVLEFLDAVRPNLPDGVEDPLILRYDPTLDPVMTLSLAKKGRDEQGADELKLLRRLGDREVRRVLEPLDGVAAVKLKGGLEEQIVVELDEGQLERTGLTIETIAQRLESENINLAGGLLEHGRVRYHVRTVNEFRDLEDIRQLVIKRVDARDVRLKDIARVEAGIRDQEVITRVDGHPAVEIEIYKEADANIVAMADGVRQAVETLAPMLENQTGVEIAVASDRSEFIASSIEEVRNTAILGGIFAIIVLIFFLRDRRSTAIVAISIPVSILITFAPLHLMGVSLNMMSLGGLALGIGMLVDNSIVVLESIHRCREEGDDVVMATIRGTEEVGGAVVASTLTSIAVFFPMVFVEGVAGQMFGDLGMSVVFSLLASLAVALFLIPMLASRTTLDSNDRASPETLWMALRRQWVSWRAVTSWRVDIRSMRERWWRWVLLPYVLLRTILHLLFSGLGKVLLTGFVVVAAILLGVRYVVRAVLGVLMRPLLAGFSRMLEGVERVYPRIIRFSLRHQVAMMLFAAAAFGGIAWGMQRLETELIPELHQNEFTVAMKLPVGTPLPQTDRTIAPIESRLLQELDSARSITLTVGDDGEDADGEERGPHTAWARVTLTPSDTSNAGWGVSATGRAQRVEAAALEKVRNAVAGVPDLSVDIVRPALFSFKPPIEIEVRSHDLEDLERAANRIANAMRGIDGLRDVTTSLHPGSPEVHIAYDREALAQRGLDLRTVAERVRDEVQGTDPTEYRQNDRKIPILIRVDGLRYAAQAELAQIDVGNGDIPVTLGSVATLEEGTGPSEIRRIGQRRVALIQANVDGMGLNEATQAIEHAIGEQTLPEEVTHAITGQSEEWETSSRSLVLALGLSVFLVYVIMASQFESLIYPLIILITIPLAFVGVVALALVIGMPISVVVFLGAIMLAGIVVNNAIVLIDYVGQLKARGMATAEALEVAGSVRLRPILMTTSTTVLGLLPMALGLGDGAEIRTPMALTVIAGLVTSTGLTLIIIPTFYAWVDRWTGGGTGPTSAMRLDEELADVTEEHLVPEGFEP